MNDDAKQLLIGLAGQGPHVLLHTGARDHETADWLLQHVLTSADDWYLGLDTDNLDDSRRALGKWGAKVSLFTCTSEIALRQRIRPDMLSDGSVTIAYLDGDRNAQSVDTVARLLWPLMRTDGVVVWKHYRTSKARIPEVSVPVDAFLENHEHEVLSCGRQMIVKKV